MVRSNQVMPSADNASLIITVAVIILDANRKSPGGEEKARRTTLVSISCFQDIHSRNSSDERTVGLPVNPSEFNCPRMQASALRLRRTREA
jgi:hypothetical protein